MKIIRTGRGEVFKFREFLCVSFEGKEDRVLQLLNDLDREANEAREVMEGMEGR